MGQEAGQRVCGCGAPQAKTGLLVQSDGRQTSSFLLSTCWSAIKDVEHVACLEQVVRHGQTHVPQANKANGCCHGTILSCMERSSLALPMRPQSCITSNPTGTR